MTTTSNSTQPNSQAGVVTGIPNLLLRGEGAAVLAVATFAYAQHGFNWWVFAILFFTPDIFMLGFFLRGSKLGAIVYNLGHTYLTPAALLAAGWLLASPLMIAIALIWGAISALTASSAMASNMPWASNSRI